MRLEIERIEAETARIVSDTIELMMDVPDPVLVTYRTDADYHAYVPGVPHTEPDPRQWPASWHRSVVARVAEEVPGLVVEYETPPGPRLTVPPAVRVWPEDAIDDGPDS